MSTTPPPTPVSLVAQMKQLYAFLDATNQAFPASNADGTANTAAQAAAAAAIVNSALTAGLIALTGATGAQISNLAVALLGVIQAYETATKRPTLPL